MHVPVSTKSRKVYRRAALVTRTDEQDGVRLEHDRVRGDELSALRVCLVKRARARACEASSATSRAMKPPVSTKTRFTPRHAKQQ
jgi:hypothetical protein